MPLGRDRGLMQNVIYQLVHPWHWLTYGQNATALAAIAGMLGLFGLTLYTLYTRSMMAVQQSTASANIRPLLVTDGSIEFIPTDTRMIDVAPNAVQLKCFKYKLPLSVRNIGQGVALFVHAWCQPISEKFTVDGSILEKTADARESNGFTHLLRSEATSIVIDKLRPEFLNQRRIIVIEAIDASSLRHQLQIVQRALGGGSIETNVAMVHADPKQSRKFAHKARLMAVWNRFVRRRDRIV